MTELSESVASPCNRQCCLNEADICIGCGRAIDEIVGWQNKSQQEKQSIVELAKRRLIQLKS